MNEQEIAQLINGLVNKIKEDCVNFNGLRLDVENGETTLSIYKQVEDRVNTYEYEVAPDSLVYKSYWWKE